MGLGLQREGPLVLFDFLTREGAFDVCFLAPGGGFRPGIFFSGIGPRMLLDRKNSMGRAGPQGPALRVRAISPAIDVPKPPESAKCLWLGRLILNKPSLFEDRSWRGGA